MFKTKTPKVYGERDAVRNDGDIRTRLYHKVSDFPRLLWQSFGLFSIVAIGMDLDHVFTVPRSTHLAVVIALWGISIGYFALAVGLAYRNMLKDKRGAEA